jgi:hypothetical protein
MALAPADLTGYTETLLEDTDEFRGFLKEANYSIELAFKFLNSEDATSKTNWKLENSNKDTGDTVYSRQDKELGKIYLAEAELVLPDWTLDELFNEVYHNVSNVPEWDKDVTEYKSILPVGKQTDLAYSSMPHALGGIVKARDVVDVRGWRKVGNTYEMCGRSVEYKGMPPKSTHVRAYKHFEHVRLVQTDKPGVYLWIWCHRIDIKGMLPQTVVDKVTHQMMLNYFKLLRVHLKDVKSGNS